MRILVCGGRDYDDYPKLRKALHGLFPPPTDDMSTWMVPADTVIIHGACPTGADQLADQWAVVNWVQVEPFPADWNDLTHPNALIRTRKDGSKYDALAGIRRNARMLREGKPDLVIAFPGGSGTRNMIEQAQLARIRVIEVK